MAFSKITSKFKKPQVFQGIEDLTIDRFRRVLESADLFAMVKTGRLKKKDFPFLEIAWIKVYDEYLREFGLNEQYEAILVQEEKIAKLKIQMWVKGQKHLLAVIKAEEIRLFDMKKPTKGKKSFEADLVMLQKYNGFLIPSHETTVKLFFTYVKAMEKEAKEIKRQNNARKN